MNSVSQELLPIPLPLLLLPLTRWRRHRHFLVHILYWPRWPKNYICLQPKAGGQSCVICCSDLITTCLPSQIISPFTYFTLAYIHRLYGESGNFGIIFSTLLFPTSKYSCSQESGASRDGRPYRKVGSLRSLLNTSFNIA